MSVNREAYFSIKKELDAVGATLVAVSKTKPVSDILELYELGHRDFGENYVQELVDKATELPKDIRWHFIGHLQSNKVKYIAPFVHLIHGVDSINLIEQIDRQGKKHNRIIPVLLQIHIAKEETKFGLDEDQLAKFIFYAEKTPLSHTKITGLMGMASFTEDTTIVENEFRILAQLFDKYKQVSNPSISFTELSMGMSSDYHLALKSGSNLVRIGSLLFGHRK